MPVEPAALPPQFPPGFRFGVGSAPAPPGGEDCWPEDLALLDRLGVDDFRLALDWQRLQPTGSGPLEQRVVDGYERMVDDLLDHDIAPMVALPHLDLPAPLAAAGGWRERTTVDRYADLVAALGARLGDRVAHWVPLEEPGRRPSFEAIDLTHHLLLAHGRGVIALRTAGVVGRIGCSNSHAPIWPASPHEADVAAAKLFDALWNGAYLEPMLLGRYPADLEPLLDGFVRPGDLATIRQPLDFYGVSYRSPLRIGAAPDDPGREWGSPFTMPPLVGYPETDGGRPVVPDALREWLIMVRARFRAALPPIVITENGALYDAAPDAGGVVDDQVRIAFHSDHLRAVATAIERGVDIAGYYASTLVDDDEPYGLVGVDPRTLARTPKRSFSWYAGLIARERAART